MINDEDYEYLQDIIELDGTEYGEYLSSILDLSNEGYGHDAMSEGFKKALFKELQDQVNFAKENIEIEEYQETITRTYTGKRIKDR